MRCWSKYLKGGFYGQENFFTFMVTPARVCQVFRHRHFGSGVGYGVNFWFEKLFTFAAGGGGDYQSTIFVGVCFLFE